MPSWFKFSLYLFGAGSVAFTIAGMLKPFGLGVNLLFAIAAAYLVIVLGRRKFPLRSTISNHALRQNVVAALSNPDR